MIPEEKSCNTMNLLLNKFNKFYIKIRKHSENNNNTFELISLVKEGISDYDFVINSIKNKIKELKDDKLCLYIIKVNLKSIKIYNKEDWDDYYNNGIIQKYIDEKNKYSELKFEYAIFKDKKYLGDEVHKIKKIENIINNYYEPINFLEEIIDFIKKNENFLISFKNHILQTIKLNSYIKTKYKNENFSSFLTEKVNEIKKELNKLKDINTSIKDINNKIINSEILKIIPKNNEIKSMYEPKTNLNLKNKESNNNIIISNNDEEDFILDFNDNEEPTFSSFMSFYKNRDKFRENLNNETMNSINPMKISNI